MNYYHPNVSTYYLNFKTYYAVTDIFVAHVFGSSHDFKILYQMFVLFKAQLSLKWKMTILSS